MLWTGVTVWSRSNATPHRGTDAATTQAHSPAAGAALPLFLAVKAVFVGIMLLIGTSAVARRASAGESSPFARTVDAVLPGSLFFVGSGAGLGVLG